MNFNFKPLLTSHVFLLLVAVVALNQYRSLAAEEQTLNLDPKMIRDAIAEVLRSGDGVSGQHTDDGYAEAAQEYLEHVQTVLADAASPSELYIREQLADVETLTQLLDQLHRRKLNQNSALRLAARLLKGPAKDLVLPALTAGSAESEQFSFENNAAIQLLNEAAHEIRRFLADGKTDTGDDENSKSEANGSAVTDRLKTFAEQAKVAQPIREFLDGVLDRTLELEGRKVRFNVEFPDAKNEDKLDSSKSSSSMGEPKVTRLADTDDDDDDNKEESRDDKDSASKYSEPNLAKSLTSSSAKSSSSTEADDGRNLFDQVLCRKAAESIAAALANDASDGKDGQVKNESAILRIEQLRRRNYQPAGLEAMLEAIEACL